MITYLSNLRSTNNNGQRTIHIIAHNDDQPTTANLVFTICTERREQSVQLQANESLEISQPHKQSGICLVEVQEETSGEKLELLLNLDQPESD